ncbi:prephenate dehydrogenase [Dictyobacter arantiisoli]|uniref:Prephenate dehydrogenase n=1 Tax=Dictyobacter arantiisoli TaxID=2014874 RepID=A0A5A5TDV1_9CHLR|nr:prephenate dehydrogenase/arogenate dehydrogenase family protein [Dictyobacter arantiisoli]GCF09468.1 prephenate dehydrogenase [Dictyobacter arantiisoli]
MFNHVAIIGLGLIGGSIGLGLKKAGVAQKVVGYDSGPGVGERARKIGVIDQACTNVPDAVRGADLVILATPVGVVRTLLQIIAPSLTPGTVVTDVSSTKSQVITWAEEFLPTHVSFVGGHPMAGKEVSGIEVADADLFQKCIYCLTPTARTPASAVRKVAILVELLGAHPRFIEPSEHDGLVAAVSHLPFLASTALMSTVAEDPTWADSSLLASSGFRDATRLAAGSPEMYRDICFTNSAAIVRWMDAYVANLSMLRDQIAMHSSKLNEEFARSRQLRLQWQDLNEETE